MKRANERETIRSKMIAEVRGRAAMSNGAHSVEIGLWRDMIGRMRDRFDDVVWFRVQTLINHHERDKFRDR